MIKLSNGLERMWKEAVMARMKYYICMCLEGLRKIPSNPKPQSGWRRPGRDSNRAPSECEARAIPLREPARVKGAECDRMENVRNLKYVLHICWEVLKIALRLAVCRSSERYCNYSKHGINLNVQNFSPYLTGNTSRIRYIAQSVNAVWGNSRCLL
jgi:hypothetical protein